MKIHPVGTELFHMDGHTDRQTNIKKLTVAFRNFANAPKTVDQSCSVSLCSCIAPVKTVRQLM
jgi:hypothetical protein